ncbi:MAG: DctP family TRAP transporter solute-binding subunit [Salinarimonadaceae bacterium]|nr:MAG: DctP family TRAP transporter solute-binding subunit [Salinarimonadaceae bacterium]
MSSSFLRPAARALTLLLSLGVASAALAADPVTIRVGFATGSVGPHAAGANAFKEELERLAPGRFNVEMFPGGSLGGEREMAEGVQLGSLEMAITGTAVLGNFVPEMMVVDIPFLFRDYDHARAVMDGPIGDELIAKMGERGFVGLAFGEVGFRHLTNSRRPSESVDDLQGLKIRTMENSIHLAAFRALGAQPTPMAWTEVLTALQQGTIDGQENPLSIIVSTQLWETQKYLTLSNHVYTPVAFYVSPGLFNSLTAEEQEILTKAAHAGRDANRAYIDESERAGLDIVREHGMEVSRIDPAEFQERLEPLYVEMRARFGDLIDEIQAQ